MTSRSTVAPTFGPNTYLKSGNYYFEDVTIDVSNAIVTGGWADQQKFGDKVFVPNFACTGDILHPENTPNHAMVLDKASGSTAGATCTVTGSRSSGWPSGTGRAMPVTARAAA